MRNKHKHTFLLCSDDVRPLAGGVLTTFVVLFLFASTLTFPFMYDNEGIGLAGAFGLYAAANGLTALITQTMAPETRGKTLEQLKDLFED